MQYLNIAYIFCATIAGVYESYKASDDIRKHRMDDIERVALVIICIILGFIGGFIRFAILRSPWYCCIFTLITLIKN